MSDAPNSNESNVSVRNEPNDDECESLRLARAFYEIAILKLKKVPGSDAIINSEYQLLHSASQQGYAPASHVLGRLLYEQGRHGMGTTLIVKAARQGQVEAMYDLHVVLKLCYPLQSLEWLHCAANAGHHLAQLKLVETEQEDRKFLEDQRLLRSCLQHPTFDELLKKFGYMKDESLSENMPML